MNPIAGMGGAVGLKGTDGREILEEAVKRGAKPNATRRADEFVQALQPAWAHLYVLTGGGALGGNLLETTGLSHEVVYESEIAGPETGALKIAGHQPVPSTTARDTRVLAKELCARQVDLLVFVGGDGTARDVLAAVGTDVPCLGVPAGVKIHSSVFAVNTTAAARLILQFMQGLVPTHEAEVMDIDEAAFRDNQVSSKLFGYMRVPHEPTYVQASKSGSPATVDERQNQKQIARFVVEHLEPETTYFLGPGTTTLAVSRELDLPKTLLGVDVFRDGKILERDAAERDLLDYVAQGPCKIIVTAIGSQGFVFGRGNLQFSHRVLEKVGPGNITIILTRSKFASLPDGKIRIDARNPATDAAFRGYYRVIMDYGEYRIVEMV